MDPRKLREALRKQGIHVHESDPVLETAAICEVVLGEALKTVEGVTKAAADRMSAASTQTVEDAKKAAAALVNSSTAWVTEQLKEAADKVTASMLAELREETARAQAASRFALRAAWVASAAAVFTAAGLAGFLLAAI
ncbi:MAG: hypothetical protein M3Y22_11785 [Pseudomonadota bacterium]|nr:hypothetical protein [Pseudomonadota bacterium]